MIMNEAKNNNPIADAFKRGDNATALKLLQQLADQGYAKAQNNLGVM